MAIDWENYNKPATRADIGHVAINTSAALRTVIILISQIQQGAKPSDDEIKLLTMYADRLEKKFDELSRWVDDE